MNDYFSECLSNEEVKIEYRHLCKLWHPDLGSQDERDDRTFKMQEINAAYAQACAMFHAEDLCDRARRAGQPEPNGEDYADAARIDERIREAIESIVTIQGLEIEICGLWVWVGGDTQPNKEALKAAGYRWSTSKAKWYFPGVPAGGWSPMNMDAIRLRYGSQRVPWQPPPSQYATATTEEAKCSRASTNPPTRKWWGSEYDRFVSQ